MLCVSTFVESEKAPYTPDMQKYENNARLMLGSDFIKTWNFLIFELKCCFQISFCTIDAIPIILSTFVLLINEVRYERSEFFPMIFRQSYTFGT